MKNPPASLAHLDFVAGIPSLDLSHFTQGTGTQRAQFVQDLGAVYREVGFVAIGGHGIPQVLIDGLYSEAESFFALPAKTKAQHEHPEHNRQRGFVSFGTEHAKDSEAADLKEFWQVGQCDVPEDANLKHYPPNAVVAERPLLSVKSEDLYRSMEAVGRDVLKAISLHLNMNEDYFEAYVPGGSSILRLIHYPPILQEPQSSVRAGQHEDINLITLLVGATADGLQVMDHDGTWIEVEGNHDHIIVDSGDMLQNLTNGLFKSTTHRVVNPPDAKSDRYSMPMFVHPRDNVDLTPLPEFIEMTGGKALYDSITAGEYLHQRLVEIGLAS